MIYIQPYYFWSGHYKVYTDSLHIRKKDILIRPSFTKKINQNEIVFKPLFSNYRKNFFNFILSRIANYLYCLFIILINSKKLKKHDLHFLEFEPFSVFIFIILNTILRKKLYFTIHSTSFFSKKKILLFLSQRIALYFNVFLLNFFETKIIVHKKKDKDNLRFVFKEKNIFKLNYPAPKINYVKKKFIGNSSLIVLGQIREDKNIEPYIDFAIKNNFKVTIAGEVTYNEKYWINLHKKKKIKLINSYLNEKNIIKLVKTNDFIFLPYGKHYSGSAGPLKDSLSFGQPVICSDLKYFSDLIKQNKIGYILNKKNIRKIKNLNREDYIILRQNCLKYAMRNNFNNFHVKHLKIYNF